MDSKSSKHFKLSPVLIKSLRYNKERWHTNLRLIHEKCMLKIYNLKINNGIFQGDSLHPLPLCRASIHLSIELKILSMVIKLQIKN